jgi:hypothetical protein
MHAQTCATLSRTSQMWRHIHPLRHTQEPPHAHRACIVFRVFNITRRGKKDNGHQEDHLFPQKQGAYSSSPAECKRMSRCILPQHPFAGRFLVSRVHTQRKLHLACNLAQSSAHSGTLSSMHCSHLGRTGTLPSALTRLLGANRARELNDRGFARYADCMSTRRIRVPHREEDIDLPVGEASSTIFCAQRHFARTDGWDSHSVTGGKVGHHSAH